MTIIGDESKQLRPEVQRPFFDWFGLVPHVLFTCSIWYHPGHENILNRDGFGRIRLFAMHVDLVL